LTADPLLEDQAAGADDRTDLPSADRPSVERPALDRATRCLTTYSASRPAPPTNIEMKAYWKDSPTK
jgi:hypothetical protein